MHGSCEGMKTMEIEMQYSQKRTFNAYIYEQYYF